jgi:hypothetical protein
MPIDNKGNLHYHIPEEIENRIPEYFYIAMAGELCSIFGWQIFEKQEDSYISEIEPYYDLASSTGGWYEAFKATCKKLDMNWLLEYYRTLAWYDSDMFDGVIENRIITNFIEKDDNANSYYRYLCIKN